MKNNRWHLAVVSLLVLTMLSCKSTAIQWAEGGEIKVNQMIMPLLTKKDNVLASYTLSNPNLAISEIELLFLADKSLADIAEIKVYRTEDAKTFAEMKLVGSTQTIKPKTTISLTPNTQGTKLYVVAKTTETPDLLAKVQLKNISLYNAQKNPYRISGGLSSEAIRFGLTLRERHQDQVDTYRIPGLATTNNGTLIAVYDNRYNGSRDLQGHIDVGMSRSIDGGQTWQPMKTIMDMKEWGGLPQDQNGIGDPAVLVDKQTGTIWVAALWLHGGGTQMAWWASKPGLSPEETGQFVLVKSDDDGLTWSEPINITKQIKNPDWYLFFNGPGSGISLKDGKIMFAAQYKDHEQIPHSTLIYSEDHGRTWKAGVGAKSHTTEAQVVELSDGKIMLNMRDDRNRKNYKFREEMVSDSLNGRSVAITTDFGKSWIEHHTSRSALPESNCMASIISVNHLKYGNLLFFSNPNSDSHRNHITIKMSQDDGNTWNKAIEVYEQHNYGYSCLTLIDENHIGILYEGAGDLYFQKVAIDEFFK